MQRNQSGCPDPTYEQALWGIRREEKVRAREKKYGICRGDLVTMVFSERPEVNKKAIAVKKKMRVYDLCKHHIVLQNAAGYKESFQWQEFFERVKIKSANGRGSD